jgi:hypothetical protein
MKLKTNKLIQLKKPKSHSKSKMVVTLDKIKINNLFKRVFDLKHNIAIKKYKEKKEKEKERQKIDTPELHFYKINQILGDYFKSEKQIISDEKRIKGDFSKFNRSKRNLSEIYLVKGKVNSFSNNINDTLNELEKKLNSYSKSLSQNKNNNLTNSSNNLHLYNQKSNFSSFINFNSEKREKIKKENVFKFSRNSNYLSTNNIIETNISSYLKNKNQIIKQSNTLNHSAKKIFSAKNKLTKTKIINRPFYTSNIKDFISQFQRIKNEILKSRLIHKKHHLISYNEIDKIMDNIEEMKMNKLKDKYLNTRFPTKNIIKNYSIKNFQNKLENEIEKYDNAKNLWDI